MHDDYMSSSGVGRPVGDPLLYARRLRGLFDSLPALIAYWDAEERNALANAALLKWYGLTPEQIQGKHLRDVLGDELYDKDLPSIRLALGGEEQVLERDLIDAAGAVRHTQTTYFPDTIEGESKGFFAVDADITPWVEATRALDEAQVMAQIGSSIHDVRSDVIVWTDELYRIFGVDPDEFTPTVEAIALRVHPDDVDRLRVTQQHARATGEGYDTRYRIVHPDGDVREVRGRERAQEGHGTIVRYIGTIQDLTEINAAARELGRINSELARVNQVNADVVAMLGHEVRTPLMVMLGYLEVLVGDWDTLTDAVRLERAERVQRAAQRFGVLVENILEMAASDAGELTPAPADIVVGDVVGDALTAIAADGAVQVTVGTDLHVRADPFHVRQIVSNLVTNALRYGEPPVVVSAVEDAGGTVTVRVRDEGPGVHPEALPTLFDRFTKPATSRAGAGVAPGTGFGLYIATRLATLNHGRLVYEPAESGACFALTLPASVAPDSEIEP